MTRLMKSTILGLSAAAALAMPMLAGAQAVVGQAAPAITATDTNGKTVSLADYKGKVVVLEWVNPGCPFVQKHYNSGNMPATQKEAAAKGAVWLAVNSTSKDASDYQKPADLAGWMTSKQATPTATLMDEDGKIGRAYGARTTPHMYVIDPQGKLVYAGGIDSIPSSNPDDIKKAVNYVRTGLGEALAGKPISAATTRPYGCSIKYKS